MFTVEDILGEFIEAAAHAPQLTIAGAIDNYVLHGRMRRLRAYHRLHARPEWRKARAAKMRAYRARKAS